MLVWHGSHVGRQEQKNFSPLRIKLKFHVNSWKKFLLYWPPTWPPCHWWLQNKNYQPILGSELVFQYENSIQKKIRKSCLIKYQEKINEEETSLPYALFYLWRDLRCFYSAEISSELRKPHPHGDQSWYSFGNALANLPGISTSRSHCLYKKN